MGTMVRLIVIITLCTQLADAQAPSDSTGRGRISGLVIDSVAGKTLSGASVQIVPDDNLLRPRTVRSDSLGRYTVGDLADGRYLVGFLHPMLDSLGLEPLVREVFVRAGTTQRLDLSIPSPNRIRAKICGPASSPDSGAIVIGFARNAHDGSPASNAKIVGEWHDVSITPSGVIRSTPRIASVSLDNGWFSMCGVPRGGTMGLTASRGPDSSGVVDIDIPANGFARRDLYIAAAPVRVTDTTSATTRGGKGEKSRTIGLGQMTLRGTVRRVGTGQPIRGARVVLTDGPSTTTDERGEWALKEAPAGTRMLEVSAVGLYPERRPVNVVAGAPPIHIAMNTLRAVLDTVTIRAVRLSDMRNFEGRRRGGSGRFLGARDIMRHRDKEMSDILRMQPGLQVQRKKDGSTSVYIRGTDTCEAELYIDGHYISTTNDLDAWVRPERVAGVEIYSGTMTPAQFQRPLSSCGSIVIWTK
jgi:hypothetical protein